MDFFDLLTLIGGLCLFMFGMSVMGQALERSAGNRLQELLGRFTSRRLSGFLTGLSVAAAIQSSSAATVMVVGFVNSGVMTLRQGVNVIMGANVGTTVTSWILSLSGIEGGAWYLRLLKPSGFTPILALLGLMLYLFAGSGRKKDVGTVLLGFATLMFGMETMSGTVSGLKDMPAFTNILTAFSNPLLGVLTGAFMTAVIQSSSASVGILQALSSTGGISNGMAIPIIMGQNIGTCVTSLISALNANLNGKRVAVVHLSFNVIGTVILLTVFVLVRAIAPLAYFDENANVLSIALFHTVFNVACAVLLLPVARWLEALSKRLVKGEEGAKEEHLVLDERLLATPAAALKLCRGATITMAKDACGALTESLDLHKAYDAKVAAHLRRTEKKTDDYEDVIGSYLVKLGRYEMDTVGSDEAAKYLRLIGDFERIADHAIHLLDVTEEMREKKIFFSDDATAELSVLTDGVREITSLALRAFTENDLTAARRVEPLEQVIDDLKEKMRIRHITRLQQSRCSIETGFIWNDMLTDLARTADHCSNIAVCVIETMQDNLNLHRSLRAFRENDPDFKSAFAVYLRKYALPVVEK